MLMIRESGDLLKQIAERILRVMGSDQVSAQKYGCGSLRRIVAVFIFRHFVWKGVVMEQQTKMIEVTHQEAKLIRLIRSIDYGEVRVMIKENAPIRAEEIRRSIQLTEK